LAAPFMAVAPPTKNLISTSSLLHLDGLPFEISHLDERGTTSHVV
jgi:hypothetical protein